MRRAEHLEQALHEADHDPQELERIEERLFTLACGGAQVQFAGRCARRLAERHVADLALINAGAEQLAALEKAAQGGGDTAMPPPPRRSRPHAGRPPRSWTRRSNSGLKPLKLERAKSATGLESDAAAADRTASTGSSSRYRPIRHAAGPLMKVASGGELARFLLALKVVLADAARQRR